MNNTDNYINMLMDAGNVIGLEINDYKAKQFLKYMDLLLEWNKKINLTSITGKEEIIIKHFIDSLMIFSEHEVKQEQSIIDVGTGAGFPGLPMKIFRPDLNVVLLDSLQKRVKFLQEVILSLNLDGITAVHGRAEEFAKKKIYRESFDLAVSRAVAKLPILVEVTVPFIKVNGYFISFKGPDISEEMKSAEYAVKEMGAEIIEEKQIKLPFTSDQRSLVIIQKSCITPEKYPRKAGMPQKRPLIK